MSAHEDAKGVRDAIKGLGTDDAKLVGIITKRSNAHLQAVSAEYIASFGKSIIEDIKGDTSGNYRELLVSLVEPRPTFIARTVHNAVKGLGTDEHALIDALIHTPNAELKAATEAYQKLYNKSIIEDVAGDLSGDFKHLMVGILAAARHDGTTVDGALAATDADALYKAGEGKTGTDENAFVEIFLQRSRAHIIEINRLYAEKRGHDLIAAIDSEFSGNLRLALKGIATPRNEYWAKRIHSALSGLGTNDHGLIRAFVLNDRAQLKEVEAAYRSRSDRKRSGHKQPEAPKGKKDAKPKKEAPKKITGSLVDDIKGDTSGWFEKSLLSLLE
eukprot:Phypoly_transcript_11165.p1 GENE.Phypoly_transcript_11165~~Phypoly_transcript_11165.p1  ORF type:complete len:330 (+),score=68.81 Phypoly_transcript_11165:180-1169(+)